MKKSKKTLTIVIVLLIIVLVACFLAWWRLYKIPHDNAVKNYNSAIAVIEKKNTSLDNAINNVEKILKSGNKPFDDSVFTAAEESVKQAKASEEKLPESMPNKTKDIEKATSKLNTRISYDKELTDLSQAATNCSNSIQQMKQVTKPDEAFVMERLGTVDGIVGSQAVTEDNDPNGNLNKAGGYTADVYFQAANVDQSQVYGQGSIIDKGTEGGGCVEVYASAEDANRRNQYLSNFDGGILANGSHTVVGTCVIRISDLLTASQQKELEQKVINALIALQ